MSKSIQVKKDEESGEYYLDFDDLKDLFEDSSIVDQYSLEWKDDGSIIMEFFDKDGNKIIVNKL